VNVVAPARALVLFSLLTATPSQNRPDFSGKWVPADVGQQPNVMTVTQDSTTVTIVAPTGRGDPQRVTLKLDGSESTFTRLGPQMAPQAQIARAFWQDNKLVITMDSYSGGEGAFTINLIWSLEGDTLLIETVRTSTTGKTLH